MGISYPPANISIDTFGQHQIQSRAITWEISDCILGQHGLGYSYISFCGIRLRRQNLSKTFLPINNLGHPSPWLPLPPSTSSSAPATSSQTRSPLQTPPALPQPSSSPPSSPPSSTPALTPPPPGRSSSLQELSSPHPPSPPPRPASANPATPTTSQSSYSICQTPLWKIGTSIPLMR